MLYLAHYGELALKGRNRGEFERRLQDNLAGALRREARALDLGEALAREVRVRRLPGRFLVELPAAFPAAAAERRLSECFGLARFAPCRSLPVEIEALEAAVLAALAEERAAGLTTKAPRHQVTPDSGLRTSDSSSPLVPLCLGGESFSFAVRAHRADKSLPFTSHELNVRLGAAVQRATGWRVNLDAPELEVALELLHDRALLHFGAAPGPGGLPVGMSGRVLVLLSGGLDSPVAAWRMLKRGCRCAFLHFHSAPLTDQASQAKVVQLVERLARWQGPARLTQVPFLETQRAIVAGAPAELRVLLYRRFMVRVAAALAGRERTLALVTGEALGQVASQTLANLAAIEAACALPILRPLIGMDKQEIVDQARRLGTFEISVQPHQDCCSFLLPERVATAASPERLDEGEKGLDVPALVAQAVAGAETITVDEEGPVAPELTTKAPRHQDTKNLRTPDFRLRTPDSRLQTPESQSPLAPGCLGGESPPDAAAPEAADG